MKERNNNQEKVVHMPPVWCSSLCRNAMNEVCVEHCSIRRDCSAFEPKPNLKLSDMPRFPKTEHMTKEEKFTSVTIYLAKVVDRLQGIEDEAPLLVFPRTSRAVNIGAELAEVAASLKDSLSDTAAAKVNETNPNPLSGSESNTTKERE